MFCEPLGLCQCYLLSCLLTRKRIPDPGMKAWFLFVFVLPSCPSMSQSSSLSILPRHHEVSFPTVWLAWCILFTRKAKRKKAPGPQNSETTGLSTPQPSFTAQVLFNPVPRKHLVTNTQIHPAIVYCALTGLGPGGHVGKAAPCLQKSQRSVGNPNKQTKVLRGENE